MDVESARRALERFGCDPGSLQLPPLGDRKSRAVWRAGNHVLKWVADRARAEKVAAAGRYLWGRGLPVPPALPTPQGQLFWEDGTGFYLLFPWVEGRQPRYEEPGMIAAITAMLARFHQTSAGYVAAGGTVGQWQVDWMALCTHADDRLRRLARKAARGARKGDAFSQLLATHMPWLAARSAWVLEQLPRSGAAGLAAAAHGNPLLGHGDYGRQNVLATPDGGLAVIDLDLVAVSLPVRDLSRLINWINHDLQDWSGARFQAILKAYGELSGAEYDLLLLSQVMPFLIIDIAREYYDDARSSHLEELERCVATDRDKLKDLGIGPW